MAIIGYARVSTEEQNTGAQIDALRAAGCADIFEERASGGDRARPVLARVIARIARGDTLVVARIDRLARSLSHLLAVIEELRVRGAYLTALKEVGGPSFFALLVIAVAFLPVFTLEAQEGRLFKPLAFTKNFAMAIAAVLAITLVPATVGLLFGRTRPFSFRPAWMARLASSVAIGTIHKEDNHPISRPLMKLYHPVVEFALEYRWTTILAAVLAFGILGIQQHSEFIYFRF